MVIAARDRARLEEAVADLQAKAGAGARVGGAGCDVARREDVQALWDYAAATLGPVDLWINNAGLARTVWAIADVPQSEVEAMITINMLARSTVAASLPRACRRKAAEKYSTSWAAGATGSIFRAWASMAPRSAAWTILPMLWSGN